MARGQNIIMIITWKPLKIKIHLFFQITQPLKRKKGLDLMDNVEEFNHLYKKCAHTI